MNKRLKIIVSGLLCLMIVVLTGCQAIGGLDINKALTNAVSIKSFEGNGSLSLEFTNDGTAKPLKLGDVALSSLGKLDLTITSMKQSEPNSLSLTGKVSIMNHSIPFSLQLTKAQLSILIDNNPKPIVFKLDAMIGQSINIGGFDISAIFADPDKLLTLLSPFVISKLPDLKNVSVSTVNEKINEESLDLQKVHVELNSAETLAFAKGLLKNIADKPEEVKILITQVLRAFYNAPVVKEGETDYFAGIIDGITQTIVDLLKKSAAGLDTAAGTEGVAALLNDKTSLKTDVYLDSSTQIRKLGLDVNLGGAIKAAGSFSFWKVNQPVTADPAMTIPSDAFQWGGTSIMAHLLKSMNSDSDAYKLLYNDLKVLKREIKLVVPPVEKSGKVAIGSSYISKDGRTMVPVRYISETLDSEVTWDAVKKQATIVDIMTGKTIIITLGSKNATVDGVEVPMDNPATAAVLVNGSTYVPLGFISQALTGEKAGWDQATKTVSISKK
jgi:hypothetical protein